MDMQGCERSVTASVEICHAGEKDIIRTAVLNSATLSGRYLLQDTLSQSGKLSCGWGSQNLKCHSLSLCTTRSGRDRVQLVISARFKPGTKHHIQSFYAR